MPVSPTRNSISVEFDGDVWRSTLGSLGTGITSVATTPFDAIALTLGKAREQGWAFDNTHVDEATAKDKPADATPAPAKAADKPALTPATPKPAPAAPATPAPAAS